jgi:segregation and condensation protein A
MLLPPDEHEEEEEGADPRAELIARLLEYQRFKEAAGAFGERQLLGRDVFDARGADLGPRPDAEREIEVGLFELIEAFRHALKAARPSGAPHEVEAETITVRERMLVVVEALELRGSMEFDQLLLGSEPQSTTRALLVATFLAILELSRLAALRLYQSVNEAGVPEGPIHLRSVAPYGGRTWTERIRELM